MTKRSVTHLSKIRRFASGTTITGTTCNRFRCTNDGMNLTDDPAKVTCKFCLRLLRR